MLIIHFCGSNTTKYMVHIKYTGHGERITLYDSTRDSTVCGTLYFSQSANYWYLKVVAIASLIVSLIGFSIFGLPLVLAESKTFIQRPNLNQDSTTITQNNPFVPLPSAEPIPKEFEIAIPKINLVSKVITNVDPSKKEEYEQVLLTHGVAHAKGSYLPGEKGPVVLFAHSTDTLDNVLQFNAQFFSVKDLDEGDEILMNYNGKNFKYLITTKEVVNPGDLSSIQSSADDLVLSTCWPPGTSWQRLLVFARQEI